MIADTQLSLAQDARLAGYGRLADAVPENEVKVIGWDERRHGPVLRFADGRVRALSPMGRLVNTAFAV